jgi:protein tyrosine/serine phosphatase
MVAAFLLDALGVRWDQVMADFLRSNEAVQNDRVKREIAAMLARAVTGPVTPEAVASLSGVRGEWLGTLFTRVAERYGSVTRYLTEHIGIGQPGIARLRDLYLDPA